MTQTRWLTTTIEVLKALARHKATYKFLGLLVVTFGVAQGGPLIEAFGRVVCVLYDGCVE